MAIVIPTTMGDLCNERTNLYPIFQRACNPSSVRLTDPQSIPPSHEVPSSQMAAKRLRKTELRVDHGFSIHARLPDPSNHAQHTESLEVDLNQNRKKRRKSTPSRRDGLPFDNNHAGHSSVPNEEKISIERTEPRKNTRSRALSSGPSGGHPSEGSINPYDVHVTLAKDERNNESTDNGWLHSVDASWRKPAVVIHVKKNESKSLVNETRLLRYDRNTGTIGPTLTEQADSISRANGKPAVAERPSLGHRKPNTKVVIIRYSRGASEGSSTGTRINSIFEGKQLRTPIDALITKPTERFAGTPWWLRGKKKAKLGSTSEIGHVINGHESQETLETPRCRGEARAFTKPVTSAFTGFGSVGTKMLKHPGTSDPPWPWYGMVHNRGFRCQEQLMQWCNFPRISLSKSKYHAVEIGPNEDLIGHLAARLNIHKIVKHLETVNLDDLTEPSACLRVPTKRFYSGFKLQQFVQKELITSRRQTVFRHDETVGDVKLQATRSRSCQGHAALSTLYASVTTSLSAFDKFEHDTQCWTQKYSPNSANDVLQAGREITIMKEWLQTLKVLSVDTGSECRNSSTAARINGNKIEALSTRKRKSNKLNDFLVSSDADDNDDKMDELTDLEDESSDRGLDFNRKSVIRSKDVAAKGSKEVGRLTNAILLSGPCGCGKSAAVYAVAKDLGFEVFEINPSSRRSGKDILERVGDMTRNHQVQRSKDVKAESAAMLQEEDDLRISDALAKDMQNGRQGTMNSFFKPKAQAKPTSKSIKAVNPLKNTKIAAERLQPKHQKQSLILLEEVDILYDDDKQFWATIMTMITMSKRPVIMTCNDESAVPVLNLSLHAIIRFSPPPIDLAVDCMLLIAANEGHIIKRRAIEALYESRGLDLRASLMELNFWCQFAVGDRKAGLEWLEPRWPVGSDLDKHGDTKRIISEGTYKTGMGWLSQDFLASHSQNSAITEEILHEVWNGWGIDPEASELFPVRENQAASIFTAHDTSALRVYDDYAEAMSILDMCSSSPSLLDNHKITLDKSLPYLTPKARSDYPVAHDLIEAIPKSSFDDLQVSLYIWLKTHTHNVFHEAAHLVSSTAMPQKLNMVTQYHAISLIRSCSSSNPINQPTSRCDISQAFDPISYPPSSSLNLTSSQLLEPSIFDRSLSLIVEEVAPYVRSIVRYDEKLRQERIRMSGLLSEGGSARRGKRMRTTRSALSALEGGQRKTTRRERYFGDLLRSRDVEKTGGLEWGNAVEQLMSEFREAYQVSYSAEKPGDAVGEDT